MPFSCDPGPPALCTRRSLVRSRSLLSSSAPALAPSPPHSALLSLCALNRPFSVHRTGPRLTTGCTHTPSTALSCFALLCALHRTAQLLRRQTDRLRSSNPPLHCQRPTCARRRSIISTRYHFISSFILYPTFPVYPTLLSLSFLPSPSPAPDPFSPASSLTTLARSTFPTPSLFYFRQNAKHTGRYSCSRQTRLQTTQP